MSTHVAIIGSALSGNKGASAMLEAAIEGISRRIPDARFTLFSMYPDEDRALNHYPNLTIVPAGPLRLGIVINSLALLYWLLPPLRSVLARSCGAIKALRDADVLLDQGGITFCDGREKFLLYNVASVLPALFMRVPVVKCAQAMGPFRSRVNRLAARAILPRMRLIVSRGRITHGHVEALGIRPLQRGADLAFTLEHAPHRAEATLNEGIVGCAPSVVMQKKIDAAGSDYVAEMAQFITYLVESGRQVVLVPHSARAHTSATHNNDLPLCRSIHAALAPHVRVATRFSNRELSARELRTVIAGCDVFVTSRFHAMVSGLATGTPTLVLGWSHKYIEVLEMFGAEDFAIAHGDYSQECLRSRFTSLWQDREVMAARLREALPGVRAVAEQQLDAISDVLGAGQVRPHE